MARSVLEVLNKYNKTYMPDKFGIYNKLNRKYSIDNQEEVMDVWLNRDGNAVNGKLGYFMGELGMRKMRGSKAKYHIFWEKNQLPHFNYLTLFIDIEYLKNQEKLNQFMSLCRELISICEPVQGVVDNLMDEYALEPIDLKIRHPELQWFNIFGKPYVELFGREKLLATPCYEVYEISEDLIAIQLTRSPFEQLNDEVREPIKNYLGKDAFVEKGKSINRYKEGVAPKFDFSSVLFDPSKGFVFPGIKKRGTE